MKKTFIISILLSLSISLTAQTKQQAIFALKENVIFTNKQLPFKAGFFTMQKVEIQNNDYIVYMNIDENQQDLDEYIDNMNKSKSNMFSLVAGQRQEIAKVFIASGLNIRLKVTGNLSKRTRQILLSSTEIKNSLYNHYSSEEYLKDIVDELKKNIPEDWGDGLTLTEIKIEGNYICYQIKTDETILTIPLLDKISHSEDNEMENSIIEELNNSNDTIELFLIRCLKRSNMGIKYTYWSEKTPKSVVFVISHNTIKSKVKDK